MNVHDRLDADTLASAFVVGAAVLTLLATSGSPVERGGAATGAAIAAAVVALGAVAAYRGVQRYREVA